jgi:predicted nucleic acid-binding Zn ribbon protein
MAEVGYVYECDRCGERITVPRPVFDKSLCPRSGPDRARCLGHLQLIEADTPDSNAPTPG